MTLRFGNEAYNLVSFVYYGIALHKVRNGIGIHVGNQHIAVQVDEVPFPGEIDTLEKVFTDVIDFGVFWMDTPFHCLGMSGQRKQQKHSD